MIFEQITPDRTPASQYDVKSPPSIGQAVEIHHRPIVSGDTIVIPGTIIRFEPPYCYVDTEFQKNQKLHQKHLSYAS